MTKLLLTKNLWRRRMAILLFLARLSWGTAAGTVRGCWARRPAVQQQVAANLVARYSLAPRPERVTPGPRRLTYGWALTRPADGHQRACIADSDGRERAVIDLYLN